MPMLSNEHKNPKLVLGANVPKNESTPIYEWRDLVNERSPLLFGSAIYKYRKFVRAYKTR